MGYSYLKTLHVDVQSKLLELLQARLQDCHSTTVNDLIKYINTSSRFYTISNEECSFRSAYNRNEFRYLSFPAILQLKGQYSRIHPYFSLENDQEFDSSNPQAIKAIFELVPLTNHHYFHCIPYQIQEWSEKTFNTINNIYKDTESNIKNGSYLIH